MERVQPRRQSRLRRRAKLPVDAACCRIVRERISPPQSPPPVAAPLLSSSRYIPETFPVVCRCWRLLQRQRAPPPPTTVTADATTFYSSSFSSFPVHHPSTPSFLTGGTWLPGRRSSPSTPSSLSPSNLRAARFLRHPPSRPRHFPAASLRSFPPS